jgi:hypothetical protein
LIGDHFEVFYNNLVPIDDDLAYHISQFEKLKFSEGKEKHARNIMKIVDIWKRRLNAYKLYSEHIAP